MSNAPTRVYNFYTRTLVTDFIETCHFDTQSFTDN